MANISRVIVTTSWDDGHPLDLKIADFLSELGMNGTFYISPHNGERRVMGVRDLKELSEHFEIGAHTRTHARLQAFQTRPLKRKFAAVWANDELRKRLPALSTRIHW